MLRMERMQVASGRHAAQCWNPQPQVGWAQGERHRGDPSLIAWGCPVGNILRQAVCKQKHFPVLRACSFS